MQVAHIDVFSVKVPLGGQKIGFFSEPKYFEPSWIPGFRQSEMRMYVLKLTTDTGISGYSAMPAMGTERFGLGNMLGSYLFGINPLDTKLINQRIQEFSYIGMRNGWVEAAFWDIIGKVQQKPLYAVLGGSGGSVYPYASTGSTYDHSQQKIREIVKDRQDKGFRGIKLRVKSTDLNKMLDFVGAAREAAGPEMSIMVDANQGWPVDIVDETPKWTLDFALQFAKGLEQYNIKWLEEPLNKGNFAGLAELTQNTTTPIAGGEMNSTWPEFKVLFEKKCLRVFQPDAILVGGTYAGGISVTKWIIDEVKRRNAAGEKITFSPHTWTTGIGFAVGLQLVGLLNPEERSLLEYPLEGFWEPKMWASFIKNDIVTPKADGKLTIPDTPGLGIEINDAILRKFGKRIYHGDKFSIGLFTLLDRGWKQTMYLKQKKEEQLLRTAQAKFEIPSPPF
ncbi:MAG: mandelate racemase/muconate lactonizing enzyme family protein [Bacteroidia bacterium]|nr:mandelate racemase/muconate lactonizing enzyme family protein [Bacteroidia bacterium]